jgi:hypothetical protein
MMSAGLQYRIKVFRTPLECTTLEFGTLWEALCYFYSARIPGFDGQIQLWDQNTMIESWDGRSYNYITSSVVDTNLPNPP